MKIEEFERLKAGARLLDEIQSYKMMVEDIEKALKDGAQVGKGILYTEGEDKLRMPLTEEVTRKALDMALADHKSTIARLEKEFAEL